jgi:uncharacterized protein YbbC (DUF1343 family)
MFKLQCLIIFATLFFSCHAKNQNTEQFQINQPQSNELRCGAERSEKYFPLLKEKTLGIVANHTSMIGNTHLVDSLTNAGFSIKAIFAPEHGFRGKADAGEQIADGKDLKTGITVFSLYGNNKKPSKEQLSEIDLMIFDIQDVGARFYTYISTMHYVMEACAENNIPLLILDRPNPNGNIVDGPVLDTSFKSFVGMHPVPIAHGMTVAEYARMINGELWLKGAITCELDFILCENYTHNTKYKLPIPPSPNLPNQRSIELYPSICLFEATNLSIGRGTNMQFQVIGHPDLKGIAEFQFTPVPNEGSKFPKHQNTICYGWDLREKPSQFSENKNEISLDFLLKIYAAFPVKDEFFKSESFFDKLAGGPKLREQIMSGTSEEDIRKTWEDELNHFKHIRQKYLLYK